MGCDVHVACRPGRSTAPEQQPDAGVLGRPVLDAVEAAMFGCTDAAEVLGELDECRREYPDANIRLTAFDSSRQCQRMSFVIQKRPPPVLRPHHLELN